MTPVPGWVYRNYGHLYYFFSVKYLQVPNPYPNKHKLNMKIIYWRTAFLHEQWANRPCDLFYQNILFFFTNSCEPELAQRLQTSKMRRNSTSLDSCQHDYTNIVTISVARWRRPCVKHFTTLYAPLKHVSPNGDYFTPKGLFFAP